jgi:uncharacterized protein (DUF1501 family)
MTAHSCRGPSRRQFLKSGVAGTLAWALAPGVQSLLAADAPAKKAKACILLYMNGGPSHIDTWDPKPGQPTGGPFQPIQTAVAGIQLNQFFPELAKLTKDLAIIRSMTSKEDDHDRARYYMHTGNNLVETPNFPDLGALAVKEWPAAKHDLPTFVSVSGIHTGPGFFGLECAPYVVSDAGAPITNIAPPASVPADRQANRLRALEGLDRDFAQRSQSDRAADHARLTQRALKLMTSKAVKAFEFIDEKPDTLKAYGVTEQNPNNYFAKGCLLARRLVENGVRFVEVMLDGWDTHADNFNQVTALNGILDTAMSRLLVELKERKLLEQTLVVWMGEFGRTPVINGGQGRDHWPNVYSAVLAGGGVKGGQVVGASDDTGSEPKNRPVPVPDLFATLMRLFGVDPGKVYTSHEGRPLKLAAKGKVVTEVL